MPDQKLSGDSFEAAYETLAEVARGGSGLEKTPYTHTHTHQPVCVPACTSAHNGIAAFQYNNIYVVDYIA